MDKATSQAIPLTEPDATQPVKKPADRASYRRLTARRLVTTLVILVGVVALVSAGAILVGSEHIAPLKIARILGSLVTGRATSAAAPEEWTIIADIRLPRILMAIVVGAALSVAGAAYQGLLRNPLADPYILGVSTGSALGAILATIYAESIPLSRPIAAFTGAVLTMGVVHVIGQARRGASTERLILAGVITNTFLSSLVIFFLTTASGSRLRSVFSWLIGDLSGGSNLLPITAAVVAVGAVFIYLSARGLNLLMVGEEDAAALGVDVRRVRLTLYLAASLITGAATAISGVIGFVGLIVPHAVRMVYGSDNRIVIPAAALVGAAFLLLGDTLARTVIAPQEVHIGVITALVGAPIFIYLLRRVA